MTPPKRHHYLPEMYLAGFTDDGTRDGKFYVYSRRSNSVAIQTPVNTGVIGHWYSVQMEDGSKNSYLETWLSEMESRAAPGIEKLRLGGKALSPEERLGVAKFIAFLWTRGPDLHHMMEDTDQALLEHGERFASKFSTSKPVVHRELPNDRPSVSLDELRSLTKNGRVKLPREKVIPVMLFLANGITNFVAMADWTIIRAPAFTSFVTTDCPVIAVPEVLPDRGFYPRAPLDFDVPKLVPISSSALLAITGKSRAHGEKRIGQDKARAYNVLLAVHANDFVIARDEAHVRSIVARAHLADRGEKTRIWPPPHRTRP